MTAARNPSHALALVAVDELARNGVTDAVLAPGSRSTALAMAFHDDDRIRLHVVVDERSAGFVAVGLARVTGRPAAVVTTSGTATANLHPAVLEADAADVPLLLLTADRPPELRDTGANQTVDQIKLYGDAPRWFVEVGVPEDRPGSVPYWRATFARAVAEAVGLRSAPGPVHLNVAFREPTVPATDDGRTAAAGPFRQPLDGRPEHRPWVSVDRSVPAPVPRDDLVRRLATTDRGVVVVGATPRPLPEAGQLARRLGWPLIAEPTAGVAVEDHAIVHASALLAAGDFAADHRPDLVVRFGRPTVSRHVQSLLAAADRELLVDGHGRWNDPSRSVTELVVADPAAWCSAVGERLDQRPATGWLSAWQQADARAAAAITVVLRARDAPSEPQVARDVAACLPAGALLAVASSMPIRDLDTFASPRADLRVISNRGVSGIDGFVGTALGAALAHDGPVVALAGDLSFLHDRNALLLSPDGRLAAVFVVVDNDGGAIFHFLPQAAYPASFERVFGTPHGRDLADVASTHDIGYHRPDRATDVAGAVLAALAAGGIHLVHVRTDRAANAELHRELQGAVARAVAG